ncbi:MAG: NADH dehydrogenase [Cyclobacteriaceae bacterium]|nr:MAG: NADH dehydrogenase [Cyclobacteriaceae bacterium]
MELKNLSLQIPESNLPRVVIVGGGFAGLELAKGLKHASVQVVMLDRNNYHTFQPLLYQVATSGLEPDSIAGPLRKVFDGFKDFYFRMVKVDRIDHLSSTIETPIGNLSYDYLVLACGSKANFFGLEHIRRKSFPLKQVVHALNLRSQILQNFEKAVLTRDKSEKDALMNFVVVGGGPTGVEVAGALGELKNHVLPNDFPDLDFNDMEIHLIEGTSRLLGDMSSFAGAKAKKYLQKFNTNIILNRLVKNYDGQLVYLDNGDTITTQTLIWAAGVQGNLVDGVPETSTEGNRILVDQYNRVAGVDNIFAIGDLAVYKNQDYPKGHPMVAQVAIQQGRRLARNLAAHLAGKSWKPFEYKDKGSMATIGRNKAVVDLPTGMHFGGFVAWLIWMFVHLFALIGFRNKMVTFINWLWSYLTFDKGNRLIIRKFDRDKTSPVEAV